MKSISKIIGVALSGGGSKGIAHAGALQYFEEIGIKPQLISGTSAGAIVGALYANGMKPIEILAFFKSIYLFHWKHFTFKKPGIVDSKAFKNYFEEYFNDKKIGDLPIELFITGTNLIKGKLKVFDKETKISDAVLASASFPGVIAPYIIDDNIYSDGGILNDFPSDLLQGRCDTLIGVYVGSIQNIEKKDVSSIKGITIRAINLLIAQNNFQKFNLCDVLIEPKELVNYNIFETNKKKMEIIYNIGYQEAKKVFEESNKI